MIPLTELWLPIVVATVFVFIASNLIWMVLQFHKKDWGELPDEDAARSGIGADTPPGEYSFPFAASPDEWKSEDWQSKMNEGPVGFVTIMPKGMPKMGKTMVQWIVFIVVIEIFVAYLAGQVLPPGEDYLRVFQVVGTAAILGFAGGIAPEAIWMGRKWGNVIRMIIDGIVYGLITAGTFGWLWPG